MTMRYRGTVEGFYGTPWSHADRLRHLDYLGAHRMNTYVYAPKDDPYHRELWREPYPDGKLAELAELVARAAGNGVAFTFAVSPGLSMRYTSEEDLAALLAKFEAVYAIGGRAFNLALDDIDYTKWHSDEDLARFGGPEPGGSAGRAQAHLLNRLQEWACEKGDVAPLQMVPTEYSDVADTPYKRALRDLLDPGVVVMWTGVGVVPATITRVEAAEAVRVYGHEIIVWDNYPVNDYLPGRVPLADYRGRERGLSEHVAGLVANPMNQAAMSEVALFSVAEYTWDDATYDPRASWRRALAERAGGRPEVSAALAAFADVCTLDERLHLVQAPALAAAVDEFWRAWRAGQRDEALARLRPVAERLAGAPAVIRAGADERFVAEAAAWLSATELWGRAMVATVDRLAGGSSDVDIDGLVARAGECRDHTEPHRKSPVRVGDGVIDRFLADTRSLLP